MYNVQPEEVKRQIISAIADLKTDMALGFLSMLMMKQITGEPRESTQSPL